MWLLARLLFDQQRRLVLQSRGRLLEAENGAKPEANALLHAIKHLLALSYKDINFIMDAKQVLDPLREVLQASQPLKTISTHPLTLYFL